MTVLRLLELTKRLLPVATEIDDALLLMWLSNCENTILTDVLLASPENCKEIVEATDAPLLVPHPFDKLYLPYMAAQICYANQEFDRYANFLQLYNAYVQEYNRWICETANPIQGQALQRGYYLSAYAIAVEHGYHGSVEDWLASLKGERGEKGEKGDRGEKGEKGDRGEVEIDVTEEYESWKARTSGDSSVRAFFLSDEIIEPGAYVVYAAGYTWKLRYTTAKGGDGSLVWRWVESYSEDGFFSLHLYAEQNAVLLIEPDGDGYRVYDDEFALKSYVDERTEKDVTAEYEAWQAEHPEGTEREFLWTLPDGTYRLGADTYMHYMQRITTDDETFRWITEYSDICEISLYQGNRCVFSFDGATTVKLGEKLLATKEFVEKQIADLEVRREPYTEIEKFARRGYDQNRSLRIHLHGLEPFDDGHLRLALWRCSRKYARYRWAPARKVSDKEDHSIGYGRVLVGVYASVDGPGPKYPPAPEWMPNEGLAEPFYSVYAEDGSLLPYVEIPLDSFVLPLVKPEALTADNTEWEADPWEKSAVVGTDRRSGFVSFRFDVEKEDGTVVARCKNTVKIGARNGRPDDLSGELLYDAGGGAKEANLTNWYVAID